MTVGPLRPADIEAALALSTGEGWNQTAADWRRLMALEPEGCFAAREGSRVVGTVTTTTYGRALAWIGMMVVHPDSRRRGLGAALMRRALDHAHALGIARVMLDATPAGRPLYEALGFVAECEVERWQGVARSRGAADATAPIRAAREAILALDEAAYDVDRSNLLDVLIEESPDGPLVMESESGLPLGCALARPGRTASYVGPLLATTREVAIALLDGMLARYDGREVCLDRHHGGHLDESMLAERGLAKRRILTRMCHGPANERGAARSLCASAGPEFG